MNYYEVQDECIKHIKNKIDVIQKSNLPVETKQKNISLYNNALNNIDEYTKHFIMNEAIKLVDSPKSDARRYFPEDFLKKNLDSISLNDNFSRKCNFLDSVSSVYGIGVKYMDGEALKRHERTEPIKRDGESDEQFLDRKEKYDLEMCALGQKGEFEFQNDIKQYYQNERIKLQQRKNEEIQRQQQMMQQQMMQQQMMQQQMLNYQREMQEKFKNQKQKFDNASPLKKAWLKVTKKAVNNNGTWIVPDEEDYGRSIR